MSKCLIAEYSNIESAKIGLEVLETDNFTLENVSVISSVSDPAAEHLRHLPSHTVGRDDEPLADSAPRPSATSDADAPDDPGAGLGTLIGGSVAAPIAAFTMVGPFMVAGPLVGMAIGAAVGGLMHHAERWGVGRDVGSEYEQRVRDGSVLIIVNDEDEIRLHDAAALLKTTGPKSLERFEVTE